MRKKIPRKCKTESKKIRNEQKATNKPKNNEKRTGKCRKWTERQNQRLIEIVENQYDDENDINWNNVKNKLNESNKSFNKNIAVRTVIAIKTQYKKLQQSQLKKKSIKWSSLEEFKLINCVEFVLKEKKIDCNEIDWNELAQEFQNRSGSALKRKYKSLSKNNTLPKRSSPRKKIPKHLQCKDSLIIKSQIDHNKKDDFEYNEYWDKNEKKLIDDESDIEILMMMIYKNN